MGLDTMSEALSEPDGSGMGKIAQIRAILASADRHGRADEAVLDDIAGVVGERRRHGEVYQKPLG